jgi:hypothetical protein
MRDRVFFLGIAIVGTLALSPSVAFSQAQPAPTRIPQQIVINGQMASGAYVTGPAGQLQSYTCPSPQQYTTADGNSQGWACYEQTTGVWLLNAVPPAPVPQAVPAAPPAPTVVAPPASAQPPFVVFPRPDPAVIYQAPPPQTVIYQPAPTTVIYQQPAPTTVVYAPAPPPPVVVAPAYPSSVILGKAAIDAAGRIASAVILNSHHPREYITYNTYEIGPGRGRGRRW